jgi:hypothetical protein
MGSCFKMERLHDVAYGSVELHVWDSYIDLMEANVATIACDGCLREIRAIIFEIYEYLALWVSARMCLYLFPFPNRPLDLPLPGTLFPGIIATLLSLADCVYINNI